MLDAMREAIIKVLQGGLFKGHHIPKVLTEPQGGPIKGGETIINPFLPGGKQNLPHIPKVKHELLVNPGIQEQNLGNVK